MFLLPDITAGETGRAVYLRVKGHQDTTEDPSTTTPVGQYFQLPGHSRADMEMVPFEKVMGDRATRKQRERFYINKYNMIKKGLNLVL